MSEAERLSAAAATSWLVSSAIAVWRAFSSAKRAARELHGASALLARAPLPVCAPARALRVRRCALLLDDCVAERRTLRLLGVVPAAALRRCTASRL